MHIDESLLEHVADTRQFNEQYAAAMAASPLGFATAEDALRTREFLDAAVVPLPPDRLQPEVLQVGAAEPAVTVRGQIALTAMPLLRNSPASPSTTRLMPYLAIE